MRMYYVYSDHDGDKTGVVVATSAEVSARRKELNSASGMGVPRKNIGDAELDVPTTKDGVIDMLNFMLGSPSSDRIVEKYSKK